MQTVIGRQIERRARSFGCHSFCPLDRFNWLLVLVSFTYGYLALQIMQTSFKHSISIASFRFCLIYDVLLLVCIVSHHLHYMYTLGRTYLLKIGKHFKMKQIIDSKCTRAACPIHLTNAFLFLSSLDAVPFACLAFTFTPFCLTFFGTMRQGV